MYAAPMTRGEVDKYLASLEQPKRGTLEALRRTILDIIPEAEQCISYGMPAFRMQGKIIAGFAAFKNHLSYLPHQLPQKQSLALVSILQSLAAAEIANALHLRDFW